MRNHSLPLIGITADISEAPQRRFTASNEPTIFLPRRYSRAVEMSGGIPLLLPFTASRALMRQYIGRLDGLVISGGAFDIHPSYYNEKPIKEIGAIKRDRTEFELEMTHLALKRDLPLLGICGGAQAINVVLGGTLYQDIAAQAPHANQHEQGAKKEIGGHIVNIARGTRLEQILRRRSLEVNTTHHQAVKEIGTGLVVNATAEDGLIEGIESLRHSFVLGVQWHPEVLAPRNVAQRRIFSFFIDSCRRAHRAR
ncbi:MAG: gamma-glutamyl-gamma-aminobutyrate hydrolase family protein [Deltaproteobacteria bacterium]|nr:gamma-glutamyl-gamma-aminobutyrate hydrolase family protein [Deltaproteobacteria bacterium]MBI2232034.1 gamma-glutamyl-gamma-aminobutyrate hydrolase family protein [Deltaproteobacteria bacterium]MBI2530702.1 gamma-glutamyl-gamma-aminobutyrate hydrolase family protein [Deltaproteobacteria bacterium]MBI3063722.1 gamma-glutamyl-gamma-aminobutyrate hydrolase family protein [Deltaproteobacteria bacterium]